MQNKSPKLIVFTGPSGVGKGTILSEFLKKYPNIKYSISSTTRKPRAGEVDGVHYFFISKEQFEEGISQNKFLEWAKYNENYYGTSYEMVKNFMDKGYDVLLEIEVQGALNIMKKEPDVLSIFILPPNNEELEKRLKGRNTEDDITIRNRLNIALKEIEASKYYKYKIVNDKIENAIDELSKVYEANK